MNCKLLGFPPKEKITKELLELCVTNGVAPFKTVAKIRKGWEGKAKGLSQVLWERGYIDKNELQAYTLEGKKVLGVLDVSKSLQITVSPLRNALEDA